MAANLDWLAGGPISAQVTPATSNTSAFFQLQFTLDDIQQVAAAAVRWSGVSSAQGQPATTWAASASGVDGLLVQFLTPVAGVRINSSSLAGGPLTLKVVQGSAS